MQLKTTMVALLALLLVGFPARGEGVGSGLPEGAGVGGEEEAAGLARALELLDGGRAEEALALLRGLPVELAESREGLAAQVRAYELTGNRSWARRKLERYLQLWPEECDVRAQLAWSYLGTSDYRAALAALDEGGGGCPATPPQQARWLMLKALAAQQGDEPREASARLGAAGEEPLIYPEDRALLLHLREAVWPFRQRPLQVAAQLDLGWTSNALQGTPLDARQDDGDWSSAKAESRLWGRGRWGVGATAPSLEGETRLTIFESEAARDLSFLGWTARPGLEHDFGPWWLLVGYRVDGALLAGGDLYREGAHPYFLGHRGEAEVELPWGLTLFGGGGRRDFRQLGRSRYEVDGGLGVSLPTWGRLAMLLAMAGRYHLAQDEAFDLAGATLVGSASVRLWGGWSARLSGSGSFDDHPSSAGSQAFQSADRRREATARGRLQLLAPTLAGGLGLGLSYEAAARFSTVDSFDHSAHTVMLGLSWRQWADPFVPGVAEAAGHRPLDYGFDSATGAAAERLRDLLRRDEDAQKGCGCGK